MNLTGQVCEIIDRARHEPLDDELHERARVHILDTFIAMASGAHLEPGVLGRRYVATRGSAGDSSIVGTDLMVSAELAALANGMSAHADETDDTNDPARIHPGCSIVPAAFAAAEKYASTGEEFVRAVAVGYHVGCSFPLGFWAPGKQLRGAVQSTHGMGQLFGAAAAAAALAPIERQDLPYVLSYTAQQFSGLTSFFRDSRHVEKAFSMSGKMAMQGVTAVEMVAAGLTGVPDVLDVSPSLFDAVDGDGDSGRLGDALAGEHRLLGCDLKRYPVGMPIQAAAEAAMEIVDAHAPDASQIERIVCRLPASKAGIVDERQMPSISVQYILAIVLLERQLTFANSHDYARFNDREVRSLMERVEVTAEDELDEMLPEQVGTRRAVVEVHLRGSDAPFTERVDPPRGTGRNRLGWSDMAAKTHEVLGQVASGATIDQFVGTFRNVHGEDNVRGLARRALAEG